RSLGQQAVRDGSADGTAARDPRGTGTVRAPGDLHAPRGAGRGGHGVLAIGLAPPRSLALSLLGAPVQGRFAVIQEAQFYQLLRQFVDAGLVQRAADLL